MRRLFLFFAFALLLPAEGALAAGCAGVALKPVMVSEVPSALALRFEDGRHLLQFRSGVRNEGRGPLEIRGRRSSARAKMRSSQIVDCARGPSVRRRDVGPMGYVRAVTHQHFHLRDLERYRLVSLDNGRSYRARKRGFCIGDATDPGIAIPGKPAKRGFDGNLATACAQGRPNVLRVVEGLSVGWGDYYEPYIEGQYVDLTGLPDGQYRVLNEIDPRQRLSVADRDRSTAGADVRVTWTDGTPSFEVTGSCLGQTACASSEPVVDGAQTGSAALGRAQPALGGRLVVH